MGERRRYFFGPFRFDTDTQELRRGEQIVALAPKATGVLAYLLDNAGQLASKLELMAAVWPDTHVGDAVLKVAVREIRRALEDDANDPTYIVTVHRRGYRFVAEVQMAWASVAPASRAPSPVTSAPAAPRASLPFGGEVPLVGRDTELDTLERLFKDAAAGRPRLVFLRGDAGSGKTALVRAFVERVSDRARTAEGACLAQRTTVEPFFSLLSAIASLAGTDRPGAMDGVVVEALVRHAPTWVLHLPAVMARVDGNALRSRIAGAGQARMLRELCELLAALSAERPIVLVVEDAHFADPATLDVLEAVARDQNVGRTLLLVTYRPTTLDGGVADVDALKDPLLTRSACRFLPLPPLAPAAVERFLAARFEGLAVTEELVAVAHRRTAGNPLFLAHVSEDWKERGWITREGDAHRQRIEIERMAEGLPDTLRRMLESQLAALEPEAQQLVEAAAVAGDACTAALLAEVTGLSLERTEALAEHLTARGPFLRTLGAESLPGGAITARFGFAHGLYRDVCLARVPEARRVRLYRATAAWLEATFFGERADLARMLAHAFEHGRVYDKAIGYYARAAEEAATRLSYREAALLLGRALALAADLPDGEREAIRLSLSVDRAELRIRTGEYLAALSELEDTAARARALGADEAEARALIPLGSIVIAWDYDRALEHLRRAAERAEAAGAQLLLADARGRLAFFELCQELGDVEATLAAMRAGEDLVRDDRDRRHFTHRMACMPMALSVCSRLDEARAAFDRARDDLLDRGESYEYLLLLINGMESFLSSGHLGRAFELIDEGLSMGRRNADALAIHSLACIRANAMTTIGDHPQALSVIAEARAWITSVGVKPLGYALEVVSAEALLVAGRPQEALRMLAPAERPQALRAGGFGVPAMRFLRELTYARAELELGHTAPARARLEALVRHCEAVRQRHVLARALASWARVAMTEGRMTDAERALREALDAAPAEELPIAAAEVLGERLRLLDARTGPRRDRERARVLGALRAIVDRLSSALAQRPAERASFLAQPWVKRALGEPESPESAASGA